MKFQTILPLAALAASASLANAETFAPIGELSIDTALVRAGAKPVLSWNISYPSSTVEDVITIENNDSIITDQKVRMDIRLLGASFSMDGRTPSPVNFQVKVGSGAWENTFTGTENDIIPSNVLLSKEVAANTELNFAGAGQTSSSSWTNSRNTLSDNLNVIALKDGDDVPSYTPAFNQGGIADHVSAYIQDGKVSIGPRDVIYLIELYSTNPDSAYFDMQDLVVLATFDEVNTTALETTSTETTTTTTTSTSADGSESTTTTTRRRSRR